MFKFDKILHFSAAQIKSYAENLKDTHLDQMYAGIDANGNQFKAYKPSYARRKSRKQLGPKQIESSISPPNYTVTGEMFEKFIVQVAKAKTNILIRYGLRASKHGLKLVANNEERTVAENQSLGPHVEEQLIQGLAQMVALNIAKENKVHVVLHV